MLAERDVERCVTFLYLCFTILDFIICATMRFMNQVHVEYVSRLDGAAAALSTAKP